MVKLGRRYAMLAYLLLFFHFISNMPAPTFTESYRLTYGRKSSLQQTKLNNPFRHNVNTKALFHTQYIMEPSMALCLVYQKMK